MDEQQVATYSMEQDPYMNYKVRHINSVLWSVVSLLQQHGKTYVSQGYIKVLLVTAHCNLHINFLCANEGGSHLLNVANLCKMLLKSQ